MSACVLALPPPLKRRRRRPEEKIVRMNHRFVEFYSIPLHRPVNSVRFVLRSLTMCIRSLECNSCEEESESRTVPTACMSNRFQIIISARKTRKTFSRNPFVCSLFLTLARSITHSNWKSKLSKKNTQRKNGRRFFFRGAKIVLNGGICTCTWFVCAVRVHAIARV